MPQTLKLTNPVTRYSTGGVVELVCDLIDVDEIKVSSKVTMQAAGVVSGGKNTQGVSTTDGVQIKSANGTVWAIQVSDTGIVLAIKV